MAQDYRTHTDLVFYGFYLDKCIYLIGAFTPYIVFHMWATEADNGPFLGHFGRWTFNENGAFYF